MSSSGIVNYKDINNTIVTVKLSNTNNDKKIYGIYSGSEIITYTEPVEPYDPIIIEPNTPLPPPPPQLEPIIITKTNYYVNALGEGGVLVTNYLGEIQNGDYITASIIAGYGALQSDDLKHSYTVAKCTQDIDWNIIENNILCELDNKMYKSLLVSCVYSCN